MEHHKSEQDVKKNLEDIGFSEQEILLFFQYRPEEQLNFLNRHRKKLLEQIHKDQHQLEYLDYLLYHIKQKRSCSHEF